jgi:hypothetical protein
MLSRRKEKKGNQALSVKYTIKNTWMPLDVSLLDAAVRHLDVCAGIQYRGIIEIDSTGIYIMYVRISPRYSTTEELRLFCRIGSVAC